eukprot:CAMPEP_0170592908 /NCGR_PEP_ID=MMETSP0224-20130122/13168_1 /TAXON_ID=285029 /ORGANISM="Togula jolla, Strain CCCM 725" /LENGTH=98 /DNA_ID=CAMNT_0010916831 /DNA_START=42 /DNA_END=335 /DNA_ORIENTATION=+
MASAHRSGRALLLLGCACFLLLGPSFVPPAEAPKAAQFDAGLAATAALPALTLMAGDANAAYGDARAWHSTLLPLTTLVVPGVGFGLFVLYIFDENAW